MKLVVLTVVASMNADTGYVGVYQDMDQCKDMQGIYITHLDPSAIMVCDTVTRFQPVLIPPPVAMGPDLLPSIMLPRMVGDESSQYMAPPCWTVSLFLITLYSIRASEPSRAEIPPLL